MENIEIVKILLNIDFWSALSGFAGALLIFFFGLPPKIDPDDHNAEPFGKLRASPKKSQGKF